MDKETKKELIKLIKIIAVIAPVIIYGAYTCSRSERLLRDEPAETYGIITDLYVMAKGYAVKFDFIVGAKTYEGHNARLLRDPIEIGDTCIVIYAVSDPSITRLKKDDNKHIITVGKMKKEVQFPNLRDSLLHWQSIQDSN